MKEIKKDSKVEANKGLALNKKDKAGKKIQRKKKQDSSARPTRYPKTVGFHGTDDEKALNPEE